MHVNFVLSEDKFSRIFYEIFQRFLDSHHDWRISVTERPHRAADVHHFHRPQMEARLPANSVVTVHHDLFDPDPFVSWDVFRQRYREAAHIICLNSNQQETLAARGFTNTTVIPHGFDAGLFAKQPLRRVADRKFTFGVISKRYPRRFKGEVFLYELLQRLPVDKVRLLFVGEGRTEDALFAMRLGFDAAAHEVMPYRLFPKVYEAMDALLMVSNFEGGPANLPEAVASGTPVVCTAVGMAPDMVRDGENGLILKGEPDADAALIRKLVSDEGGLLRRLIYGAQRASTAHTWDAVIDLHYQLYCQLLGITTAATPTQSVSAGSLRQISGVEQTHHEPVTVNFSNAS